MLRCDELVELMHEVATARDRGDFPSLTTFSSLQDNKAGDWFFISYGVVVGDSKECLYDGERLIERKDVSYCPRCGLIYVDNALART
ncbi:MAG: hypothetical protein ACP5D2_04320 [Candidatus Nanoarchaeia archaeon]